MNAAEIIRKRGKPGCRYATNAKENVIAQWLDGRWRVIHAYATNGMWINGGDGLYVNGKPLYPQECFVEVHRHQRECEFCGVGFYSSPEQRFCSTECYGLHYGFVDAMSGEDA